jgi:alkyl hydroperoxide reductase subunit F
MTERLYDTIVIGGGPAGAAAAIYAARKKMTTLVITEIFGGQSLVSSGIENWIGEENISGEELGKKLENHVRAQEAIRVNMPERVVSVKEAPECTFEVSTNAEALYRSKTVIIASGARRRRLGVPGEDAFDGKGVAYCSTCDAPFFQDQDVAVIGGGNSAFETVIDLLSYARKIYLLWRDPMEGDPVTRERIEKADKVSIIGSVAVKEIVGDQSVSGLSYKYADTGKTEDLSVKGIFVQIGSVPNSEFARGLVETNEDGEIVISYPGSNTSKDGVFAAGDVTTDPFKQNNIAAGDGVRCALSAYYYVQDMKKHSPCAEPGNGSDSVKER